MIKDVDRLTHWDFRERGGEYGVSLFRSFLKVALASKEITVRHRLTPETFSEVLSEIIFKLKKSFSHPGEAVGAIAA